MCYYNCADASCSLSRVQSSVVVMTTTSLFTCCSSNPYCNLQFGCKGACCKMYVYSGLQVTCHFGFSWLCSLTNQLCGDITHNKNDWSECGTGRFLTDKGLAIHCTRHQQYGPKPHHEWLTMVMFTTPCINCKSLLR